MKIILRGPSNSIFQDLLIKFFDDITDWIHSGNTQTKKTKNTNAYFISQTISLKTILYYDEIMLLFHIIETKNMCIHRFTL